MANDPELKTTTAIKKIGISDPSIIRRLRDKFNCEKGNLMNGSELPELKASAFHNEPEPSSVNRTMALNHSREPTKTSVPQTGPATKKDNDQDEDPRQSSFPKPEQQEIMQRLISNSLSTASSIVSMNYAIASQTFHTPAVRSLMRYQIAFSQALLGVAGPQPKANC
ncbi:MAG: hypothetical protein RIC14_07090 [Filomicrobium sp.]